MSEIFLETIKRAQLKKRKMERTNRDGFVALDNISNQGINLQRALHRESELCKSKLKFL